MEIEWFTAAPTQASSAVAGMEYKVPDGAMKYAKREPATSSSSHGFFPSISGQGVIQGDVVLGGGILPTLTLGGILNGGNNGFGAGASATVGIGGRVLPTIAVGGGAAAAVNGLLLNGQVSGTASEGGWLSGLVPPANAGGILGAEGGLLFSSGIHGVLGVNGGGWATAGYGGFFIPSSTIAINFGGNIGGILDNTVATPTSMSSSTP
ncbi:hypothetical protein GGI26_002532 [Coemansia sp. RSA 1358]|nr:hypothetical protein GGI26_002532 [Coemansia sp. RSA 1358]